MGEVLGRGIVEVEQVAGAVLGVSRTLPDRLNALTHPLAHHLGLFEVKEDAVALLLRQTGVNHTIEQGSGLLKGVNGAGKGITESARVEGLGVLAGHTNSRHGQGKAISANKADKANLERGSERPVKGVLNLQAEGEVVPVRQFEAVVGEVVDSTDTSPAIRANGLAGEVGEALRLKEVFGSPEHIGVLEDFISVGDASEDFAVVVSHIGEKTGLRAVREVERNLGDSVIKLGGLTLNGFRGGGGGEVRGHMYFGILLVGCLSTLPSMHTI